MNQLTRRLKMLVFPWLSVIVATGCAAAAVAAAEAGIYLLTKDDGDTEVVSEEVYTFGEIPDAYPDLAAGK